VEWPGIKQIFLRHLADAMVVITKHDLLLLNFKPGKRLVAMLP
jgi:hypothetical protein